MKIEGTIIEQLKTGDYRVACGAMILVRPEKDLTLLPKGKEKQLASLDRKKLSSRCLRRKGGRENRSSWNESA